MNSSSKSPEAFDEFVERVMLANGFSKKRQPDGTMALNPYVFEAARALIYLHQFEDQPVAEYQSKNRINGLWEKCDKAFYDLERAGGDNDNVRALYARPVAREQAKYGDKLLSNHQLGDQITVDGKSATIVAVSFEIRDFGQDLGFGPKIIYRVALDDNTGRTVTVVSEDVEAAVKDKKQRPKLKLITKP